MADDRQVKEIADINLDFTQWYTDVVLKTGLVDYGPVKGTMVIRPYGYGIWELIQDSLDMRIKASGHKNAYFPLFIPKSFLDKEAEHVEGFAPECATVTHVGDEELSEKLVVRPTSEAIICHMYSKWVQSYRDLPLKLNQWANVVRWEKNTRPFLRTSEFLWQEGHTVHATEAEAREETIDMLKLYERFMRDVLAIPVYIGRKSEKEKFAGAVETYSLEAMMLDGKSLQAGTTHYFGQNFSKPFNIRFLDTDGTHKYAYQTSWGVTTRLIGALIMSHGDSRGLVMPPNVAPIQTIIVPIALKQDGVREKTQELLNRLLAVGVRAEADFTDASPGWKFSEWELKGVPLRLEIGPRDIEKGQVCFARRDNSQKGVIPLDELEKQLPIMLESIQSNLFDKAKLRLNTRTVTVGNVPELKDAVDGGNFAMAMWCGSRNCEDKIKEDTQATARNMPFDQSPIASKCLCCNKDAKIKMIFAKAY